MVNAHGCLKPLSFGTISVRVCACVHTRGRATAIDKPAIPQPFGSLAARLGEAYDGYVEFKF